MSGRDLLQAIAEYQAVVDHLGGCLDGYCDVKGKAKGVHTNGGCRCLSYLHRAKQMARAGRRLADAVQKHMGLPE